MHKVIFNPFAHDLQFVRKDSGIVQHAKITQCRNNKEYIVDSPQLEEFILPLFSSHRDFIRIYGQNDFGWRLHIPKHVEVMCPDDCITLQEGEFLKSREHQYDFIELIYIKKCWLLNNSSRN